ncbi:hypothetical protein NDU88_003926 [Pleurodeles waltl]|uniref:Uncharacterized protein n=1 Tax=Pleurodeles waltl TaxID=8319 RepID=A0AAV7V0E2_PLEWA|nr:hypothetical protein NDU88_003926 [Pleurodeles waltl]
MGIAPLLRSSWGADGSRTTDFPQRQGDFPGLLLSWIRRAEHHVRPRSALPQVLARQRFPFSFPGLREL